MKPDFSTLKEQLIKLGESDLEIVKLYALQMGCFAFSRDKLPGFDCERPISVLEEARIASVDAYPAHSWLSPSLWFRATRRSSRPPNKPDPEPEDFFRGALVGLTDALKSHPNVFELKDNLLSGPQISTMGDYRLIIGGVLHFQINLPERLQRYRYALDDADPTIERISVATSGSLFAAYAELVAFPQRTWFAQEYRDLLEKLIENKGQFHCIGVPPCPMHPIIYVVLLEQKNIPKKMFYSLGQDIVFLIPGGTSPQVFVETLLQIFNRDLVRFFRNQLEGRSAQLYAFEIFNEFSSLTRSYKELLAASWWRLLRRHRLWVSARASLSNIHLRLVEYGEIVNRYEREVANFPQTIDSDSYTAAWLTYFSERFEKFNIPSFLVSSLQYFERELQLFGHKRVILTASLVSAAIAAMISVMIALLRGHLK